ncbi:hypothetical protein F0562_029088 [Nyssa sinensis]|uniref:GYF domain-containing protein n=1 Tax=Nyssa sinensis TaxID=561372 RepID=A0A5J5B231_9ASTE|nr:hypothetical protein F0562_029088 [Nyssa sinensis]
MCAGDHVVFNRKPSSGNIGSNDGDGSGKAINSNTAEKNTEEDKGHHSLASTPKEKQHHTATSVLKELSQQSHVAAPKVQHDVFLEQLPHQSISGEKMTCSKASIIEELPQQSHILPPDDQCNVILQSEPHRSSFCIGDEEKNQPINAKQKIKTNQAASAVALIELSSDDDDDESRDAIGKHKLEDPESCEWHCLGPNGERKGPYSMSLLKCWSETTTFALKFKVWKMGQSEESAVPLSDAIRLVFPGK